MSINAVGIDVSKSKSVVPILRPFGEVVSKPFEITHTSDNINSLLKMCYMGAVLNDIGRVMDIDFAQKYRTLGEIKKI